MRRSADDPTFKRVTRGEVRVSELQQGEKTEGLLVRMESRDGESRVWLSPILRGTGKKLKLALADPMEFDEPPAGLFGSVFQ